LASVISILSSSRSFASQSSVKQRHIVLGVNCQLIEVKIRAMVIVNWNLLQRNSKGKRGA